MGNMELEKGYSLFYQLMVGERLCLRLDLDFEKVCRIIGADPVELGAYIREEMGMTGDEVIIALRKQAYDSINRKYSLKCFKF